MFVQFIVILLLSNAWCYYMLFFLSVISETFKVGETNNIARSVWFQLGRPGGTITDVIYKFKICGPHIQNNLNTDFFGKGKLII